MKKPIRFFLFLLLSAVLLPTPAFAGSSAFDGNWDVTLTCPKSDDGNAMAFSFQFAAEVKNGILHGERGMANEPGWLQLDGPIKDDGTAVLVAEGLTNIPSYAVHNVKKGTHYKHAVNSKFEGQKGQGSWITIRTCDFTFTKN